MLERMMSTRLTKLATCASVALVTILFFLPKNALASDFIIHEFKGAIIVNEDASIDVTERIRVEFQAERHGLYREIPVKYEGRFGENVSVNIEVERVRDAYGEDIEFLVTKEGDYLRIRIGSEDVTVLGVREYNIEYRVERALLYFDDHDELYWNVTGHNWPVEIPESSVAVLLPDSVTGGTDVICYTGLYGSSTQNCTASAAGNLITVSSEDYLTVAVSWPKGHVYEPSFLERAWWFFSDNWIVFFPILLLIGLIWYWNKHGRDTKGRETIVPEYEPPKNLSVMEMGTLVDAKVHPNDISAGIIGLAVKGLMKIKEDEKKKLFGKKINYTLIKLREPKEGELTPAEKILWDGLFDSKEEVELNDLKTSFYKTRAKLNKELYKQMAKEKYFVKNPNKVRGVFLVVGILVAFGVFLAIPFGLPYVGSALLSGLLIMGFGIFMPKKTKKGTLAFEHAQGFKMFLETAEKYRIQWQEKEGMFEEYLPFAMVFGVADKWADALKDTMKEQPDWYEGRPGSFSTGYLVGAMNNFSDSVKATSTPPSRGAAGGSSGFSGGFSGGGFGGGGGGSW